MLVKLLAAKLNSKTNQIESKTMHKNKFGLISFFWYGKHINKHRICISMRTRTTRNQQYKIAQKKKKRNETQIIY